MVWVGGVEGGLGFQKFSMILGRTKNSVVGSWEPQNVNTEDGLSEVWKFFCKSLQSFWVQLVIFLFFSNRMKDVPTGHSLVGGLVSRIMDKGLG